MYTFDEILKVDPEVARAIEAEGERQNSHIELIASENWVSKAVMAAMGSILTNKYAEGYPGRRVLRRLSVCGCGRGSARDRAKSCLAVIMPMFSRTPGHRLTWQCFLPC